MKKQLPNFMGKGGYIPPTTESIMILGTNMVICASGINPIILNGFEPSTTEVWEEEDLSML